MRNNCTQPENASAAVWQSPREVSGDRGIYSPENERDARAQGVRHICLPQPVTKRNAAGGANGKCGFARRNASATGLKAGLVTCVVPGVASLSQSWLTRPRALDWLGHHCQQYRCHCHELEQASGRTIRCAVMNHFPDRN